MKSGRINDNVGIVDKVLDGGQTIVLRSLRGGKFICKNKGFEVGDVLCYTVNTISRSIEELIPKKIADGIALLGRFPVLQQTYTTEEPPDDIDGNETVDCGEGPEVESPADLSGSVCGERHYLREYNGEDLTQDTEPCGIGGNDLVEEEDGDVDPLLYELSPEPDSI